MKRLTWAAAAAAAFIPAVLGLHANATFSQSIPVRVPASAELVSAATPTGAPTSAPSATATSSAAATSSPTSGVDDHGGDRPRTPGRGGHDDASTATPTSHPTSTVDDHGGDRPRTPEPGDDHGGSTSGGHGSDDGLGEDTGGSGGHGSDDTSASHDT